ncbi:MAG TPA: PIN domain-containing protein [Bryobacteraceae bacterium]|nr:PIN domain-containing protein [Bryobacteraceae bacterium]
MTVFIDTSYYVAFLNPRDQWFERAENAARGQFRTITSSLILNETVSLLQARGLLSTALDWLRAVRADPDTQIVYVDAAIQSEAWDLFARWGAHGANAVDCTSFAIMRRMSIKKAFTFDRRFRSAGFETLG